MGVVMGTSHSGVYWSNVEMCGNCAHKPDVSCLICGEVRSRNYPSALMHMHRDDDPSFDNAVRILEGE